MKQLLITTIAAVVLVGCGESQQSAPAPEAKSVEPVAEAALTEPPTAKAPDISIHKAAEDGNIEAVKQHLAAGTDVNAKDDQFGGTPLHIAALDGHKEIVELLITKDADVNAKNGHGETPLDWAEGETADLLHKHGGKTGEELEADEPVAKVAKPESPTNSRSIPLVLAAESGSIESVKLHIAAGTDLNINYGGSNALYEAVLEGRNEIVELLIEAGANVNLKHGIHGDTPLYPAAIKGRKKICELLIAKGADVNAKRDNGRNPLHIAAFWGHTEVVKLLIAKGANINEKDNWDETPLDLAIDEENFLKEQVRKETADLLRKHGGKTKKELKAAGK
jgi:ankyrin repeat protein